MSDFFDNKTKKNLNDATDRIRAITTVYNMELSNLSQPELIYADVITKYSQLLIMEVREAGSIKQSMQANHRKHVNEEIVRYVSSKYKINIPVENVDIAIEGARVRSERVFDIIKRYRNAINEAYTKFDNKLWYCSDTAGITSLTHVIKENLYLNEIVDGVFASSNYDKILNSIGGLAGGGLNSKEDIIVFNSNPFSGSQASKTKMDLVCPMYIYSVDPQNFTPSVCLELIHGSKEDGSDIFFPDLRFDDEWYCKAKNVACEQEEVLNIPTSILKNYQLLYKKGKLDIDFSNKSKLECQKELVKLISKGKIGYINEERSTNAVLA